METTFKSYKLRIYLNKEQEILLGKHLSDDTTYKNIKTLKNNIKKLKFEQKQMGALSLDESMKPETYQSLADV